MTLNDRLRPAGLELLKKIALLSKNFSCKGSIAQNFSHGKGKSLLRRSLQA